MEIREWKNQGSPIQWDPTGIRSRASSIEKTYYKNVKFQKQEQMLLGERKLNNADLVELKEKEARS